MVEVIVDRFADMIFIQFEYLLNICFIFQMPSEPLHWVFAPLDADEGPALPVFQVLTIFGAEISEKVSPSLGEPRHTFISTCSCYDATSSDWLRNEAVEPVRPRISVKNGRRFHFATLGVDHDHVKASKMPTFILRYFHTYAIDTNFGEIPALKARRIGMNRNIPVMNGLAKLDHFCPLIGIFLKWK